MDDYPHSCPRQEGKLRVKTKTQQHHQNGLVTGMIETRTRPLSDIILGSSKPK